MRTIASAIAIACALASTAHAQPVPFGMGRVAPWDAARPLRAGDLPIAILPAPQQPGERTGGGLMEHLLKYQPPARREAPRCCLAHRNGS